MIVIVTGVMLLLALAGVPTASHMLLTAVGLTDVNNPSDFNSSALALKVMAIFALAAVVGVIIGAITRQSTESFIVAGISGFLFTWMAADIYSIYSYYHSTVCPLGASCAWTGNILLMILIPLLAGLAISMVQWWRGNDI